MDPARRPLYNAHFSQALFERFLHRLQSDLGPVEFAVAETPLFFTPALRDHLARSAREIAVQLAEPGILAELKKAIPPEYDVPGMDALPNCVQVDFALVEGPNGLEGKVIELQAFPSLYAMETFFAQAWSEQLNTIAGLQGDWTCYVDQTRAQAVKLMRDTIVADADPLETVLVDYQPQHQKTLPDFVATEKLFGVESICVTELIVSGNKLFRMRAGKKIPVRRIYNRMVFDELQVKNVAVPFHWNDPLDVTWCSHPNWYWAWSKFSLPYLHHSAVPRSRFLNTLGPGDAEGDLSGYVLKPLFSFAGSGVVVDVTRDDLDRVPADQRHGWVLQEKVEYAQALTTPEGAGVKAEVRMMLLRPPGGAELIPVLPLVRMSRGKMIGVDHNKGLSWVGGSVALWPAG